jgi:hypothetical protein
MKKKKMVKMVKVRPRKKVGKEVKEQSQSSWMSGWWRITRVE